MPTYGDLRTDFLTVLNRRDCTNTAADGFLQSAIQRIQRISRTPAMERAIEENVISDIAKDFIMYGGLSYACDRWNDKRGPLFEQRFTQIQDYLQSEAAMRPAGLLATTRAEIMTYPEQQDMAISVLLLH